MLQAIGERLVVRPRKELATKASGDGVILLADTIATKLAPSQGEVVSVGSRVRRVRVGQRVSWGLGVGQEIRFEDEDYLVLHERDVIGTIQ